MITTNPDNNGKAYGYWLASPSRYDEATGSTQFLLYVNYTGNMSYWHYATGSQFGLRPVVCLKEGVKLIENENGTYSLII